MIHSKLLSYNQFVSIITQKIIVCMNRNSPIIHTLVLDCIRQIRKINLSQMFH